MSKTFGAVISSLPKPKYIAEFLGVTLKCRQRHLLTRDDKLRLRVVVPMCSSAVICVATLASFSMDSQAFQGTQKLDEPVAVMADAAIEGLSTARQKRLGRYEGDTAGNNVETVAYFRPAPAKPREKSMTIGKGDTLAGVMQRAGVNAGEAYKIVQVMKKDYDPRRIKPGQKLLFRFDPVDEKGTSYDFVEMQMAIDPLQTVSLTRGEGGFESKVIEKETKTRMDAGHATIEVSLFGSGTKAGIPSAVLAQALHIYSWDIDFQRDIRKGDQIELMYESIVTTEGEKVKNGNIVYARLNINGHDIPVYRYEMKNGDVDYFTPDGVSMRKALMKTPVDGARLSSGFGMRHHPVLGYNKMHKGLDFAAPTGTPIYAAGDGTVEKAGRNGGYGNYVRIRHNSDLKTAYAHMSKFAKGMSAGKRVKQGEVIGYIGTTGRSTGPHLHYEVHLKGTQVNPNSVKLPQGETLRGQELQAFKMHIAKLQGQYSRLSKDLKLAMNY